MWPKRTLLKLQFNLPIFCFSINEKIQQFLLQKQFQHIFHCHFPAVNYLLKYRSFSYLPEVETWGFTGIFKIYFFTMADKCDKDFCFLYLFFLLLTLQIWRNWSQSLNKEMEERSETIQTGNWNYRARLKRWDLFVRKSEIGEGFERRGDANEHTWIAL